MDPGRFLFTGYPATLHVWGKQTIMQTGIFTCTSSDLIPTIELLLLLNKNQHLSQPAFPAHIRGEMGTQTHTN